MASILAFPADAGKGNRRHGSGPDNEFATGTVLLFTGAFYERPRSGGDDPFPKPRQGINAKSRSPRRKNANPE